ncbi:MAG: hypothetical protein FD123_3004 [Bacteroidetes bacterium]|nr:MAG: hypothetical protein FD123_3004 [Bacteroidota bacterium]
MKKKLCKAGFVLALSLACSLDNFGQPFWSTVALNTLAGPGQTNILGTSAAAIPAEQPLNIFTGGTQRMFIASGGGAGGGFVGIGNAFTAPAFRLDVIDDINVRPPSLNTGYRINGIPVLQIFGLRNLLVGENAGLVNGSNDNVFMGFGAGSANTTGDRNTFIGSRAGMISVNGRFDTYVGADAGMNMLAGNSNTFIGEHCGWQQSNGSNNSYLGSHAGHGAVGSIANRCVFMGTNTGGAFFTNITDNTFIGFFSGGAITTGSRNVFLGSEAGRRTTVGVDNVFLGQRAAINHTTGNGNVVIGRQAGFLGFGLSIGDNNVLIGLGSTVSAANRNNAVAIGANTVVTQNNTMILGNNVMRVGIGLSGDPTGPLNSLEINTASLVPTPTSSGLRFRDMNSSILVPTPNPGVGVLSVDGNGDVIYVPAAPAAAVTADNGATINPAGNVQLGQTVCAPGNPGQLTHHTEIPMNDLSLTFTDPASPALGTNNVGIGMAPCTGPSPFAKLHVINEPSAIFPLSIGGLMSANASYTVPFPGYFYFGATPAQIGVMGTAGGANGINLNIGVVGRSYSDLSVNNVGVLAQARRGTGSNTGLSATADGSGVTTGTFVAAGGFARGGAESYGGLFTNSNAFSTLANYGVAGKIFGPVTGTVPNYAVYGEAQSLSSGPPGGPFYAGFFNGDLVHTGGYTNLSDASIKKDVKPITNSLELIEKLNPVTYNYKAEEFNGRVNLSSQMQYGFIAQEVEKVLPDLTQTIVVPGSRDSLGNTIHENLPLKGVHYLGFIALLTDGMKQQQKLIADLQNQVNELRGNPGVNNNQNMTGSVTLSDVQNVILDQNVPNPFAEQTEIGYFLPDNVQKAQMLFYNKEGKLIKVAELQGHGKGVLQVFADDLSNGVYTYTLVADGKIIDSKKMVRQK